MTDLPAATRARLERLASKRYTGTEITDWVAEDVTELLATLDAFHAELDDRVQRDSARLAEVVRLESDLRLAKDQHAALRAERAQLLHTCDEDARSTAARLLIEQEQYAQTVRNLTERAEFAQARATAAEQAQAQAAPVLDDVMTTLDWVSTTVEGTPKQPFLEIHRRVGEQMRRLNAWRAAREG